MKTPSGVQAAQAGGKRDPRENEVVALARSKGPDASQKLIDLYARLAGDPSATGVRALALNALFSEKSTSLRLKNVLAAVAADTTPSRADPLWPTLVKKLSEEWNAETFDKGRDLMLMEKRDRAREALVASFVDLAKSRAGTLTAMQTNALLTDFIDVHAQVPADQRPAIQDGVRAIGGNDTANLLAGRGLTEGDKLDYQKEYERQLEKGRKALMKDPPNLAELHDP